MVEPLSSASPAGTPEISQEPMSGGAGQPNVVFTELAQGAREIIIEHHGQVYRLRLTRNDKLILSK